MTEKILDYSFASKWSNEVERQGYTQIPNILIKCQGHLGLSDGELITLIQLQSFWYHEKNRVFPSIKHLADYSGKSYNPIQKRLSSLEKKGFISKTQRFVNSNLYDLKPTISILNRHTAICKRYHQIQVIRTPEPTYVLPPNPFIKEDAELTIQTIEEIYPNFSKPDKPTFDNYLRETHRG